jgi:hypothetical protein
MAHDVFLSHSHADKAWAEAICHKLESNAIRCWVAPRDIRPSEDWAEAIINAMDGAAVLLLVFSSNSNQSPQVRREVERAVNKGLTVLPFRIEDVPLSKSLEYFISTQHWLDAIDGRSAPHLDHLYDCVAQILGRDVPSPPVTLPVAASAAASPAAASPAVPALNTAPSPQQPIAAHHLDGLERLLAQVLGPIAKHLVRRGAANAVNAEALMTLLALEIDEQHERQQFVARCRAILS